MFRLHRHYGLDAVPGTINCGQSWYYNIPARPGDTITMRGSALDKFIKENACSPFTKTSSPTSTAR